MNKIQDPTLDIIERKMDWNINKNKNKTEYIKNLNDILNLIVSSLSKKVKFDYHSINIINDNNYVQIDKSGKSGDKLLLFKKINDDNNFVALVKILVDYNSEKDLSASKIKEAVNSYYLGKKYNNYFPAVYDIITKDNNLYMNIELVTGVEFTEICKKVNIHEMKEILFIILHALVKIKNDKIFFRHYDIHPDNIMVQKVEPYNILFNNKTYSVNYKMKFIDLGRSFIFTNVDEDMTKISEQIIRIFDIKQREIPLASYKCSTEGKFFGSFEIIRSSLVSSFYDKKKYDDIDLYFVKELFKHIYQVICGRDQCDNNLNASMNNFKTCENLDACVTNSFFNDIIVAKGGNDPYYYKYIKYKKKYKSLKK